MTRIEPSVAAKHVPIGTKFTPALPLVEQRGMNSFQQRAPWPDDDMAHVQRLFIGRRRLKDRFVAVVGILIAAVLSCGFL